MLLHHSSWGWRPATKLGTAPLLPYSPLSASYLGLCYLRPSAAPRSLQPFLFEATPRGLLTKACVSRHDWVIFGQHQTDRYAPEPPPERENTTQPELEPQQPKVTQKSAAAAVATATLRTLPKPSALAGDRVREMLERMKEERVEMVQVHQALDEHIASEEQATEASLTAGGRVCSCCGSGWEGMEKPSEYVNRVEQARHQAVLHHQRGHQVGGIRYLDRLKEAAAKQNQVVSPKWRRNKSD